MYITTKILFLSDPKFSFEILFIVSPRYAKNGIGQILRKKKIYSINNNNNNIKLNLTLTY